MNPPRRRESAPPLRECKPYRTGKGARGDIGGQSRIPAKSVNDFGGHQAIELGRENLRKDRRARRVIKRELGGGSRTHYRNRERCILSMEDLSAVGRDVVFAMNFGDAELRLAPRSELRGRLVR